MKMSLYETVKTFELRTDLSTRLVTEVSLRDNGRAPQFRFATFRVYDGPDGKERRSPWVGEREMMLKLGLEKHAVEWVREEKKKQRRQTDEQLAAPAAPPVAA